MKQYKRVKATYDRGYVNAMDKIRVFIESNQKVMYIGTGEYANASTAQASYTNAMARYTAATIRSTVFRPFTWNGTRDYASSNSATTRKPKRPTGGLSTRG